MTIDEIKELIQVVNETGIAELEVHRGENWVKITGSGAGRRQEVVLPAVLPVSVAPSAMASLASVPPAHETTSPIAPPPSPPAPPQEDERNVIVRSPIVGTYYDSPAPDAPSFVKIGDQIQPKQVLCIIESMKLMNEIEAEMAGTVMAKFVGNGHPVEYGESLFSIRPL